MKKLFFVVVAMLAFVSTQAFAWGEEDPYNRSGNSYGRSESIKQGEVMDGTVLDVRMVKIEATNTAGVAGGAVGGIAGGAIGSKMGKGNGRYIGGAIMGILGALAGNKIGKSLSEENQAGELVVELSNGKKIFVVQEDGLSFVPGQPVYVLKSNSGWNSNVRISPKGNPVPAPVAYAPAQQQMGAQAQVAYPASQQNSIPGY